MVSKKAERSGLFYLGARGIFVPNLHHNADFGAEWEYNIKEEMKGSITN